MVCVLALSVFVTGIPDPQDREANTGHAKRPYQYRHSQLHQLAMAHERHIWEKD